MLIREVGAHRSHITIRELFQLKARFGASAQAVAYRCKDLGILSQSGCTEIFRVFSANGWRVHEPNPLRPERPRRFERLCVRAVAEGAISESKAAELLGMTVRQLIASLDKPPDNGAHADAARV